MTAQMVQDVLMFEGEKMKWINGGRTRTRTLDPLIKSQLLEQNISYQSDRLQGKTPCNHCLIQAFCISLHNTR